ncbi:MAG: phenylalanine--tRNA ligase subunit alpha [Candidatus Aenigmatarchaeota archaeon]|nr:phenylalanine--tRNA ligase subunit alpha [Candidatus Aenigmarchaeota archaeon]
MQSNYLITKEGREYLEKGTPEKRLVEILKEKERVSIKEIENVLKEEGWIAINWAKKFGWVEVKDDLILLKYLPKRFEIDDALKSLHEKKELKNETLEILLKRKLIIEDKEDIVKKAEKQIKEGVKFLTHELLASGLWRNVNFPKYNVSIVGRKEYGGKRHPYMKFLIRIREKLVSLGFKEMSSPTIELEFWNFDALYQPQDHPSRDWTQTYSLKFPNEGKLPENKLIERVKKTHEDGWITGSTGWEYKWDPSKAARLIPRAHATCCSARTLAINPETPSKHFAIRRCFRPDVIDATHGVEFHQCEGIVIDKNLSFREMIGILKTLTKEIVGIEEIRIKPDYYPFTEPSVELLAKHPKLGWIEFAGAGIFREEVTIPLGVKDIVLAWGIGIDRLAMISLELNDIRELFTRNLNWLREKEVLV